MTLTLGVAGVREYGGGATLGVMLFDLTSNDGAADCDVCEDIVASCKCSGPPDVGGILVRVVVATGA